MALIGRVSLINNEWHFMLFALLYLGLYNVYHILFIDWIRLD